jgi:hypothetical protein
MENLDKNFLSSKTSHLIQCYLDKTSIYPLVFYFKRNLGSWILMLKMMESYYSNEELNIEKLIDIVPRHLMSRISLFKVINDAENAGVLIKEKSKIDSRKKIIVPSDEFIEQYEKWLKEYMKA